MHMIAHIASYLHIAIHLYTYIATLYSYTCAPAQTHTNAMYTHHTCTVKPVRYYGYPETNHKCFDSQRN